jgi:hypothetical protein
MCCQVDFGLTVGCSLGQDELAEIGCGKRWRLSLAAGSSSNHLYTQLTDSWFMRQHLG